MRGAGAGFVTVFFSESDSGWKPLPDWVDFLIQIGRCWPSPVSGTRRLAIVSLPCDSPGAGLVALGALIRNLGLATATDAHGHYDQLLRHAHQHINYCAPCNLRCFPEQKRCGFVAEAAGVFRHVKTRKQYHVSAQTDFNKRRLAVSPREGGSWTIYSPKVGLDFRIDGDPVLRLATTEGELLGGTYSEIVPGAPILPANLRESHSGLCFAGRIVGEAASRAICESAKFRLGQSEHALSELLTIPVRV
jgi:hypothetical protein